MIREHVTIHRAMHAGHETVLGDDCLLMVGAHVAHDCHVGNHVILTNGVMLGGHVQVGDRACLGGNAAVHQFCRIGRLAMVGGCTKVVQDVPPFVLTDGPGSMIVGLNRIGLRRAGLDRNEIEQLKAAYRLIYRQGLTFDVMVAAFEASFRRAWRPSSPRFSRAVSAGLSKNAAARRGWRCGCIRRSTTPWTKFSKKCRPSRGSAKRVDCGQNRFSRAMVPGKAALSPAQGHSQRITLFFSRPPR